MNRTCFTFIVVAFLVQTVAGQENETDWKRHVIPVKERSFDFKMVAKGTTPEHQFVLTNPLQEPIHIGKITSSCTCTSLLFDATKTIVKTYDQFVLTARLQGDLFEGQRNATITLVIDQPIPAEIQLNIRGEIRTDLNISPKNFLDFGNIELEQGQTRPLTITYTGSNSQWRIVDAECENKDIHTEITSEYFVGRKIFNINVSIDKSAPHGTIDTLLTLISNDSESRRAIPIPIRATVGTVITVTPPSLFLGALLPGESSPQKNVVLRGTKPFHITNIECDNPAIDIPLKINADAPPQLVYLVPLLYKNPAEGEGSPKAGIMRATIQVSTDVPGIAPVFYVTSRIVEKEGED